MSDECFGPSALEDALRDMDMVYIFVHSNDCGPCASMTEMMKAADLMDKIIDIHQDGDLCAEVLAKHLKVESYPTIIKMERGIEKARYIGADQQTVLKMIEDVI